MRWPLVSEQKDEGSCHAFNSPPSLLLNLLFLITIGRKLYSIFQVPSKRLKHDDRLGIIVGGQSTWIWSLKFSFDF